MKRKTAWITSLLAGTVLLTTLGAAPISRAATVPQPTRDACSSALPPQLAFTGGPGLTANTITAAGMRFSLLQFRDGLQTLLRVADPKLRPIKGDRVAEFEFFTPGGAHLYAGPTHVFHHGAVMHVCRTGAIMVDATGNTTEQTNRYALDLRLDGTLAGGRISLNVWVNGKRYWLYGPAAARQ